MIETTPPPLVGEPLALDLVNTLATRPDGVPVDLLSEPASAAGWLAAQHGLGRLAAVHPGDLNLAALRTLRTHVADCVEAARHSTAPGPAALAALNDAVRAAPAYAQLSWQDGTLIRRTERSGVPGRDLLAELAEAAVALVTDPAVVRVRGCEGAQCRLLFLPAHPQRRWCSPATCGNRARVARHYQRRHG
ncbi:putative RNA-binding Zn ribbon-like protein [Hamadaea flava]|uniref:CGNR zinc finger domain-containing protein n=1 Tax=Hamadaea flava TaxID=1742688 RepID=A0ABV8LPY8_9ACTN|nr:ABATE domain-containing protein [Hamadaea flava]MCP2322956.1 putative RNA-binding Zn ribbon-like protein [Hamadaea flava]